MVSSVKTGSRQMSRSGRQLDLYRTRSGGCCGDASAAAGRHGDGRLHPVQDRVSPLIQQTVATHL